MIKNPKKVTSYVLSFSKYSTAVLMRSWQIRRKGMSIQRFIEEGTIFKIHYIFFYALENIE